MHGQIVEAHYDRRVKTLMLVPESNNEAHNKRLPRKPRGLAEKRRPNKGSSLVHVIIYDITTGGLNVRPHLHRMSHGKALPGVYLQELRKGNSRENGNDNVRVQLLSACCIQSPRISVLNSVMMVLWGQMFLNCCHYYLWVRAGNVLICLGHTAVSDKN